MIFDKFANLKYRYGNRKFWCRGYYVDTIGRNKKVIEEYIRNQLQEDKEYEQLILISIKNIFYPLALSNAHDGITRKVVDCLAETVYHLFQCSKYLIAKSSGS